ncbi:MAG: hypothetical protein A6F72_08365 [Cycloclasticus sp. symbiont of Poecilosclerida sp. N]|nr:MAG: hypothetical protein A6F72_08365 [Cycloclasticus sp. symbiont of Poecilosclerida sp. N]
MTQIILFIFLLASNDAFAHSNIDTKHGACTLMIGKERGIHITVYQPSTQEGEVFCQQAPDLVETTVVLDFMEEDSKKLPFAFSIGYMNDDVLEPLSSLDFDVYPQGSMLLKFTPKQTGKYHGKVIFLNKDGHDKARDFDFYIGERHPSSAEPSSTQELIKWVMLFILVFGGVYVAYSKRINKDEDDF